MSAAGKPRRTIPIAPVAEGDHGACVLADPGGEWIFRQLVSAGDRWRLLPLNPRYPAIDLDDLSAVRGVVIQRTTPGKRKSTTRYGE